MCAACLEHGLEPIVTFHHFTTPRWVAARGGWTEAATADLFARFCERATSHLGDLVRPRLHAERAQHRRRLRAPLGDVPARACAIPRCTGAPTVFVAAHRKAVAAIKGGRGHAAVGLTLAMQDLQAVDGGEARRDGGATAGRRTPSSRPRAATTSRGADLHAAALRAGRHDRPRARRADHPDGLRVLAGGAGGDRAPRLGGHAPRPRASDRERHRTADDRERIATWIAHCAASSPACATASTFAATSTGACSTTSSGCSATAPPSAWSRSTATTQHRTVKPSAVWLGTVARANRLEPPAG